MSTGGAATAQLCRTSHIQEVWRQNALHNTREAAGATSLQNL
jgi:hypothetical protein